MNKPGTGIRVYDTDLAKDQSFYSGHMNLQKLAFDPMVTGYSFIIWSKLPLWVEKEFPGFRQMTQKNFKAFSGLTSMTLNTAEYNHSFNNNAYNFNASIEKGNNEFAITHQEFSGSPMRNAYQYWITGISDPRTGIATYPKLHNMEYAAKNHTGELMYIMTRPDANNVTHRNIEFAAYYTNVLPLTIPLDHFNFTQGSHDGVEFEIQFKGTMNISPNVDAYAVELLKRAYAFTSENMFDPKNENVNGANITEFKQPNNMTTGSGSGDI